MGSEKKDNTVRMVAAIIFSIIFVPALFAFVPAGGVVTTLSGMASLERIEKAAEESGISEKLYEIVVANAFDETSSEAVSSAEGVRILRDSFTPGDMDRIFLAFLNAAYYGTKEEIDLSGIEERLKENFSTFYENAFDEVYSSWRNKTESVHFSKEFCRSFYGEIENQLLKEYAEYDAAGFTELEEKYDAAHGSGAFSALLDEREETLRGEWLKEMKDSVESQIGDIAAEAETMIQEAALETAHDPEVRKVFHVIRKVGNMSRIITLVVYAVILGMVLILLLLYWDSTAGFIVCAVPLLFGGIVCRLIASVEPLFLSYAEEEIIFDSLASMQYKEAVTAAMHGIISPIFKGISEFGMKAMIAAVLLIGGAILRGVMKKNEREREQSCP